MINPKRNNTITQKKKLNITFIEASLKHLLQDPETGTIIINNKNPKTYGKLIGNNTRTGGRHGSSVVTEIHS